MDGDKAATATCGREKYWGELGLEEKVERMRQVVKQQGATISFLSTQGSRLGQHQHKDGHIVVPLNMGDMCGVSISPVGALDGKEWF